MKRTLCLIIAVLFILTLSACGHTHEFGEWTTSKEAACTEDGTRERSCSCGETETDTIAASGHTFSSTQEVAAPTCTEDGQSASVCSVCGETVTESIPALGHTFGEPEETTPVTCTEDGQLDKTCTVCEAVESETVAATGHSFKAATAFAPKTCTNCGETEGEALSIVLTVGDTAEAEDHSFVVSSAEFKRGLSDKRGYITYNYQDSGRVFAIKLDFTNLAVDAFDRWNSDRVSDVALEYAGKYNYEGEYWCPDDDIVALDTDTVYIVYSVPEVMSEDAASAIYATFTIDGEVYSMVVQEGALNGDIANPAGDVAEDVTAEIRIGDTRSDGAKFSFVFKDIQYTNKPSEKQGNVTYTFGSNGSYYLVLKLELTNLATEAIESWYSERISEIKLTFSDKYTYDGQFWCPAQQIVPLSSGNVYLLFEIPETVETSTDALIASFKIDGAEFTVDCRTAK